MDVYIGWSEKVLDAWVLAMFQLGNEGTLFPDWK